MGHSTVIRTGPAPSEGIARTGVTVVLPAGDIVENAMYGRCFSLNGTASFPAATGIEESGLLTTPIALTNTHSLGIVRDAMIGYYARLRKTDGSSYWMLPVVGETWTAGFPTSNGMHVRPEHLCAALDSAASGPGGGRLRRRRHRHDPSSEFKGGIGTSSRVLPEELGGYTVGVLIQGNYGKREDLLINGVPVGRHIPTSRIPGKGTSAPSPRPKRTARSSSSSPQTPRSPRTSASGWPAAPGSASGAPGASPSTDRETFFIAFSTANRLGSNAGGGPREHTVRTLSHGCMDPLFRATVEATHEAIVNAMCAATDTDGILGRRMYALPLDEVRGIMRRYESL